MPVKRIDNLKDPVERQSGQEWQQAIGIYDLTTRELDYLCDRHQGSSNEEKRAAILKLRAGK